MKAINYKVISEKLIKPDPLAIKLQDIAVSEYNTRHNCTDQLHIDCLAAEIESNSFYRGKALHVNLDAGKRYKLIVGVNRFEALKKLGYTEVLCYVYNNLTPEEQVYLDAWDNRSDELHKPHHFLEEGEHYLLLQKQGWSTQKIAELKGKGKATICRKIQIARLPEEAKAVIKDSLKYKDTIFEERNFRTICSLKEEAQIIDVCKTINAIGKKAVQGVGRKLKNRQIEELVNAVRTNKKIDFDSKDNNKNEDEYMQQEFNFDLTPFKGKGCCTIPAWIPDLLLHPGITRDERDIISYLVRETYAHNPPQNFVPYDVIQIGKATQLPLKAIPAIIEALIRKKIIINLNGFLSIRNIDQDMDRDKKLDITKSIKPQTHEENKTLIVDTVACDNDYDYTIIDAELKKLNIENKNLEICREVVLSRGGMPYLTAQILYCKDMKKNPLTDSGYYIGAIKRDYARFKFNKQKAGSKGNDKEKPATDKKLTQSIDPPDKLLQEQYNAYIKTTIFNKLQNMDENRIIELQTRLIQDALKEDSKILNPPEKDYLTALFADLQKTGSKVDTNVYRPILETAIDKIYIHHFNLPDFPSWKKTVSTPVLV